MSNDTPTISYDCTTITSGYPNIGPWYSHGVAESWDVVSVMLFFANASIHIHMCLLIYIKQLCWGWISTPNPLGFSWRPASLANSISTPCGTASAVANPEVAFEAFWFLGFRDAWPPWKQHLYSLWDRLACGKSGYGAHGSPGLLGSSIFTTWIFSALANLDMGAQACHLSAPTPELWIWRGRGAQWGPKPKNQETKKPKGLAVFQRLFLAQAGKSLGAVRFLVFFVSLGWLGVDFHPQHNVAVKYAGFRIVCGARFWWFLRNSMPEIPKPVAQAVNLPKASKHHEGTIKTKEPKAEMPKMLWGYHKNHKNHNLGTLASLEPWARGSTKSPQIVVFMVPAQHFWRLGFGFFGFYGTLTVFGSLGQIGGLGPWARGSSKSPQIMVFMIPSQHFAKLGTSALVSLVFMVPSQCFPRDKSKASCGCPRS